MANFESAQKQIKKLTVENFNNITTSLTEVSDAVLNEIAKTYAKYLDGVDPKDYYAELVKYNRLGKLKQAIIDQYGVAYTEDAARIIKAIDTTFEEAYYRHGYLFEFFIQEDIKFAKLNNDLKAYSLRGSSDLWKKLEKDIKDLKLYTPKIDSLSNLLLNDKKKQIIKIKQSIDGIFLGELKYKDAVKRLEAPLSKSSIERIYRTELTRIYNLSSYTAANAVDLPMTKAWLATLGPRTRDSHGALDGQEVGMDDYFSSGGAKALLPGQFGIAKLDIHCRCTVIYIPAGVRPTERRGKNPQTGKPEVFTWKNYTEWKKGTKAA